MKAIHVALVAVAAVVAVVGLFVAGWFVGPSLGWGPGPAYGCWGWHGGSHAQAHTAHARNDMCGCPMHR